MNGRDEIKCSFPKRIELSNGVTVSIGDVPLPDELCNTNKGAQNVVSVVL